MNASIFIHTNGTIVNHKITGDLAAILDTDIAVVHYNITVNLFVFLNSKVIEHSLIRIFADE